MSDIKDGGPAFPTTQENGCNSGEPGMTLRDYFAAMALNAPYAHHESDPHKSAEWAYHLADAMLKAREAK
jgi:hypothetical protein